MRNPLLTRQANTSKSPSKTPEAIPPVPEEYEGDNNPYRGTESHGVEANNKPAPPAGYESTQEGVHYQEEMVVEDPVPVYVVQSGGRELRRFRIHRVTFQDTNPTRILPLNENRIFARIKNSGAEVLYLGPEQSLADYTGYSLNAANPTLDIHHQEEMYAKVLSTGVVASGALEIYEEYSVQLTAAEKRGSGKRNG